MKKLLVTIVLAAACLNCSADANKHAATVGVTVAEMLCRDAIALNVPSDELKSVCAGVEVFAPLVTTIINARENPAPVRARYMAARQAQ
jgi:hypothetical protein